MWSNKQLIVKIYWQRLLALSYFRMQNVSVLTKDYPSDLARKSYWNFIAKVSTCFIVCVNTCSPKFKLPLVPMRKISLAALEWYPIHGLLAPTLLHQFYSIAHYSRLRC
jgi:hypothetical protein